MSKKLLTDENKKYWIKYCDNKKIKYKEIKNGSLLIKFYPSTKKNLRDNFIKYVFITNNKLMIKLAPCKRVKSDLQWSFKSYLNEHKHYTISYSDKCKRFFLSITNGNHIANTTYKPVSYLSVNNKKYADFLSHFYYVKTSKQKTILNFKDFIFESLNVDNNSIMSLETKDLSLIRKLNNKDDYCLKLINSLPNSKIIKKFIYKTFDKENIPLIGLMNVISLYKIFKLNRGEIENIINDYSINRCKVCWKTVKKVYKKEPSFRNIILKFIVKDELNTYYFRDSITMLGQYDDIVIKPKYKNVVEFHNDIVLQYNKKKTENYIYDNSKKRNEYKKIHNHNYDDTIIKIPESKYDLMDWGNKLSNCIGSYHNLYLQNKTELICIEKNKQPLYTIEIRNKEIKQFVGKYNRSVEEKIVNSYKNIFKQYGVIV